MYKYILDVLTDKQVKEKTQSEQNILTTCFIAPAEKVPSDIPIFSLEVKTITDVVEAQKGTLLLFNPDKLKDSLRFFERVLEDPSAFGMELVLIKHFPDSIDSVVLDRLSGKLQSILFDEWKSSLLAAVSTAAAATRNPSNDRILEISDDKGKVKGADYDAASSETESEEYD